MKKQLLTLLCIGVTIFTFGQVPSYVPSNGLVGYWPFNGNANDESGNGNNGTENSVIKTSDRNGKANSAYYFNGNANIGISTLNNFQYNQTTYSLWFLAESVCTNTSSFESKIMIGRDTWGNTSQGVLAISNEPYYKTDNYLSYWTGGKNFTSTEKYSLNKWYHLVFTNDSIGNYKFYLNGKMIKSGDNFDIGLNANLPFNIGSGGSRFFWNGKLDDIAIWKRQLTEKEILTLYTGCTTPLTTTLSLSSVPKFCEGQSTIIEAVPSLASTNYTYKWYKNDIEIVDETKKSISVNSQGKYAVEVTDGECKSMSNDTNITVISLPTKTTTITGETTFCDGNKVTITSNDETASYLWSTGEKTKAITVSKSGKYALLLDNQGCISKTDTVVVTVKPNPTALIQVKGDTVFCEGGFILLTAKGGTDYVWNTSSKFDTLTIKKSGTYTVNVTQDGCSAIASKKIIVNAIPKVVMSPLPNLIHSNASDISLVATPQGGTFTGNGVLGLKFQPSVAGLGKKSISYVYTSPEGCSAKQEQSIVVYDTVAQCIKYDTILKFKIVITAGINLNKINVIEMFPNPTLDVLTISHSDFNVMTGYSIQISDMNGKSVFNQAVNSAKMEVSLKQFASKGMYIVYVLDADKKVVDHKKIILE